MIRILLVCLLLLPLAGCGFKDIDKRFFVVTMGIDKAKERETGYRVTLKLALPDPQPKNASGKSLIIFQEADTIAEAVRIMKSRVDKNLDFGHAKAILLGEELAAEGVEEVMDWFTRRRDIQKIAWAAVARPSAEEILQQKPTAERIPSNVLFLLFGRSGTETPYITSEYLFDFLHRLREPGLSPVLPLIATGKDSVYEVNRTVIFEKGRSVLTLTPSETKVLNPLLRPSYKRLDVRVKQDDRYFVISTDSTKVSFTLRTNNPKKPVIHYKLKIKGNVEETKQPLQQTDLPYYSRLAEQASEKRVLALLKKLQEAKVDPLGFGLRYRSRHMGDEAQKLKEWNKLYPKVTFQIDVETKLQGTGMIE